MRKTFFSYTIISLILAIIQTILVIARYSQNDSDLVAYIVGMVSMYVLFAFFGFLGLRYIKIQKEFMQKYTDKYQFLKNMYNNINLNDSENKVLFCMAVSEFKYVTYTIVSDDFPKKWKKYAENMLDNLICCVVHIQSE